MAGGKELMAFVTYELIDPGTLRFTIHRWQLPPVAEIVQAYERYRQHLLEARSQGRQLHVHLDLRVVSQLDPKLWSVVQELRRVVDTYSSIPDVVTALTVYTPSAWAKPVLGRVLPWCVGKHVKVVVT